MATPQPDMHARSRAPAIAQGIRPHSGHASDYDPLLADIGDARFVLIGEASHGTHEFYRERAAITRRLIVECGFASVAVEADWPDAYRVNRFVRDRRGSAAQSLSAFKRFPQWMWRNADVLEFVGWLARHNAQQPADRATGFYGLDLYSLHASIEAVLRYLEGVDPAAAQRARKRYACFDHVGADPQDYAYLTRLSLAHSCEREVLAQLAELVSAAPRYREREPAGPAPREEYFDAELNARVVRNAERYYRTMFARHADSWNQRDRHMMDTLESLAANLGQPGAPARIVVWAHNSHLGDARATEMSARGELNLGQLVREAHADRCYAIGFSSYAGTVTAAHDWGEPAQRMQVQPGLDGSYEQLLHETGVPAFMLLLREMRDDAGWLAGPRLQRAIGVIYRPDSERFSHYYEAHLTAQFDALLHFDRSSALEPLAHAADAAPVEEAETFPSGI
jgi:erythromycin esterase-like protein